ncbi:MAG TPA: MFS transporter [Streptosporangiaceae bacterium]
MYASGQLVSNSGTWMQRTAQDWLVLTLPGGGGTAVGITTAMQFLPLLLFGMYGGVLADRFNKRHLLMVTQAIMGTLALVLGILVVTGTARVWHVYILAFCLGSTTVLDNPTRQTFAVEMVGRKDLPNAVALNSATFNLGRILGPAIAGTLIAAVGTGTVFLLNAASFVAVLTSLKLMNPKELHTVDPVPRAKGQLREGLRYIASRRDLSLLLVLIAFVATFAMNSQITNALMSKQVFHSGAQAFGLASTAIAVGAVIGALLSARRGHPRQRLLLTAAIVFSLLDIAAGLSPWYWLFLILLVPTGITMMTLNNTANATMQLSVTPELRGRVMSVYLVVFMGGNPVGAPAIGWISETFGARWSLIGGGAIAATAAIGVAIALSRVRGLSVRPRFRPRPHLQVTTKSIQVEPNSG